MLGLARDMQHKRVFPQRAAMHKICRLISHLLMESGEIPPWVTELRAARNEAERERDAN
jgi:hypothetical protein